jgi:hypothetical protein
MSNRNGHRDETIFLLLLLLPQSGEPWKHQLDLEPMLHDAESLKNLTIMYDVRLTIAAGF